MGVYALKKSGTQFMFNLKAGNGEVILTSERYTTKANAENGIASVKTNSSKDDRYERKTSTDSQHYFVLKAANHEVIGTSERYTSASARDAGIASVKANGPGSSTDDQTGQ